MNKNILFNFIVLYLLLLPINTAVWAECSQNISLAKEIADGEDAVSSYRKIVAEDFIDDTCKSEAYYRLGGYYFIRDSFDLALKYLTIANKLNSKSKYKRLIALVKNKATKTNKFSLQVGAFSKLSNAKKQIAILKKNYETVTLKKTVRENGSLIFRVYVGSFKNKEDAELFGKNSFSKTGIDYRIVKR